MWVHSTQRIRLKKRYPTLRISSHFVQRYTLPIGGNRKATCQSCVKNYLPELLADYQPEHCNNMFYELLYVILSDLPEETQEHFEDLI